MIIMYIVLQLDYHPRTPPGPGREAAGALHPLDLSLGPGRLAIRGLSAG